MYYVLNLVSHCASFLFSFSSQVSAGAFDYLKETLQAHPLGAATDDLGADTLSFLSAIAVAEVPLFLPLL